jgi:hypothetical protein
MLYTLLWTSYECSSIFSTLYVKLWIRYDLCWVLNLQDGRINYQEFVAMMKKGTLDNDEKEKPQ